MAMGFLNFLSNRATIRIFSKLQFFLITNIKFLFRSRNYFKRFPCKIRYCWHFLHVYKNDNSSKRQEVWICCLIYNFMKKLLLPKTIQYFFDLT